MPFSRILGGCTPLLHEVGMSLPPGEDPGVSGEARRMGCGKQECVVEGLLRWSCRPAGLEPAATPHPALRATPGSKPGGRLFPSKLGKECVRLEA